MDVEIHGRGKLTAVAELLPDALHIRIDDDANDEFWAELTIEAAELLRALAQLDVRG